MQRPTTVVYCAASLDGFIARANGDIDWLGEGEPDNDYGWSKFICDIDAIVMGRVTFEQLLTFDDWHYGKIPMTVLSRTLDQIPDKLSDHVTTSALPPKELLAQLEEQGRRRVYVDGGKTIQSFLSAGLIDELIITTIPILIGDGIPLFGPLEQDLSWEHFNSELYPGGLRKNFYRIAR